MELRRTRELLPEVRWRDSSPSTNDELRELNAKRGADSVLHGTLLATANQTAGKGRAGRGWVTPADTAVAASLMIRGFEGLSMGWLSLIAGSAITAALQPRFGEGRRVGVKWPNDVHVRDEGDAIAGGPGLKLCGILCEMIGPSDVIVGTGVNLLQSEEELPTDRATSLLAAGADVGGAVSLSDEAGRDLVDRVLAAYVTEMLALVDLAATHPGAVRSRVLRHSLTIGAEVRAHLPGAEIVDGKASGLADDGSLIIDRPVGGRLAVSAGDVEHLR